MVRIRIALVLMAGLLVGGFVACTPTATKCECKCKSSKKCKCDGEDNCKSVLCPVNGGKGQCECEFDKEVK